MPRYWNVRSIPPHGSTVSGIPSRILSLESIHSLNVVVRIVNQLEGKYAIMGLMEHPDPNVQKEALLCTQKLLVVSWEHLGATK